MADTPRLIRELEGEALDLAEEYHGQGLTVDEVLFAVKVGLTAFVRILEERKN